MFAFALFARIVVGGLLAVAATAKVFDLQAFAGTLRQLGYVPQRWARLGALGVVATEAVVAAAILAPPTAAVGLGLGAVLFAALAAVAARAANQPASVPCRCFGAGAAPLGRPHVYRNAVICAVALLGLCAAIFAGPDAHLDPGTPVLTWAAGLVLVAAGVFLDDLAALFRDAGASNGR